MSTPELQSDVAAKIVDRFHKWSNHFNQNRDAEALAQALHPKSLSGCLPPGRMHITGPEAREIVSVFQTNLPVEFDQWMKDTIALEVLVEHGTNMRRIVAVARRACTK